MNIEPIFHFQFAPLCYWQVTIDDVGDRLMDYFVVIYQEDRFVPILHWHADIRTFDYIYPNYSTRGWEGIVWAGGATEVI